MPTSTAVLLALLLACGDKEAGDDTGGGGDGGTADGGAGDGGDGGTADGGGGDGGDGGGDGGAGDGGTTEVDEDEDGFPDWDDCDDGDAAVNPDATEVCNGIDDDCDDWVDLEDNNLDESTLSTWYPDADLDGYGDDDGGQQLCEQPDLTVAVGGDCDDEDALVNPLATEVCGDGVDNDCDADLDGCVLSGTIGVADALLVLEGPDAGALAGTAQATGHLDADETLDLVLAGPGAEGLDGVAMGAVWVVHGEVSGTVDLNWPDASWSASSVDLGAEAGVGRQLVVADADDDGFHDVVVVTPGGDYDGFVDAGSATVLYGPLGAETGGDLAAESGLIVASADGLGLGLGAQLPMDLFGNADLDLLLGTDGANALYLYDDAPISRGGTHTANVVIRSGTDEAVGFGAWFDGRADLDGDGQVDLLVAAPGAEGGLGSVYLLAGPITEEVSALDADAAIVGTIGPGGGQGLGEGLVWTEGDLDGDGADDVLLGDPDHDGGGEGAGAAFLFRGPLEGGLQATDADLVVLGEAPGLALASSGLFGADMDLDGRPELLLGAPGAAEGAGQVLAYVGARSGTATSAEADVIFAGDSAGQALGSSLGVPADLDGDGILDVLAGAPGDGDAAGATFVFRAAAW